MSVMRVAIRVSKGPIISAPRCLGAALVRPWLMVAFGPKFTTSSVTFGTWYLQANPQHVREIAELTRHSDFSQVMKYALSDEQRARVRAAKL